MTPEQQRIAIAEACGKGRALAAAELSHRSIDEYDIPDYLNDLNAMNDTEQGLDDDQWLEHMLNLCDVLQIQTDLRKWTLARALMSATASQRAEAFLRTLNLWKEDTTLARIPEGDR